MLGHSLLLDVLLLSAAPLLLYRVLERLRAYLLTFLAQSPTPIVARLLAPVVATYKYTEEEFYGVDGAPLEVQQKRRAGLEGLAAKFAAMEGPKARELNDQLRNLSDVRFTDTNRVPHAFQPVVRSKLKLGFIAAESDGPYLIDVDGNRALDISGSYGVNVHGYNFYKACTAEGNDRIAKLGPNVLGPLHPCAIDVINTMRAVSGLDEVSFHCSGTEAMMCAVRLCRFNTRRKLVVQFIGAYHGWWDGVQTGPGSERPVPDVLTLKDLSPHALKVIRARSHEIAAVLISPLQGLNPGSAPPSDLVLMAAEARSTADKDDKYRIWLEKLRALCTDVNVPLLFDEVYTGFRMAVGGAQQYYGIQADMVAYGKTLGGGMPVGVVCGKRSLMQRFDPEHPLRVAYVIGTFAAAPSVLGPMAAFLEFVTSPTAAEKYERGAALTAKWVSETNKQMKAAGYPIRVDHLTTVWTILYQCPSRYHWLYQYYMRAEGLAMAWVGTGRCLFSLDFEEEEYELVTAKLLAAAAKMEADGWWWKGATAKSIKKQIVGEYIKGIAGNLLSAVVGKPKVM